MASRKRLALFLYMLILVQYASSMELSNNFLSMEPHKALKVMNLSQDRIKELMKSGHEHSIFCGHLLQALTCAELANLYQITEGIVAEHQVNMNKLGDKQVFLNSLFDNVDLTVDSSVGDLFLDESESYYEEIVKIVEEMHFQDDNSLGTTKKFFKDSISAMRMSVENKIEEETMMQNYFRAKKDGINYELFQHFEQIGGVYERCPGLQLDDTCEQVLSRNPVAVSGNYKLSGAQTSGQQENACTFTEWTEHLHLGPERFTNGMKPAFKVRVPEESSKIMFINKGLQSLRLDDINYGTGFNLNLLCFKMSEGGDGEDKCYHWDSVGGSQVSGVQPANWEELGESALEVLKSSSVECMINGQQQDNFCVDVFVLNLEGKKFKGITDKFSAEGQSGQELVYDFAVYYS